MTHLVAHGIDMDVASLGFDEELVGMLILQREPAVTTLTAAIEST